MRKRLKVILYVLINLFFILSVFLSLTIYTSLMSEKLSWYEPCGMQFLAVVFILCPTFLIIGILQLILGRFMAISKWSKLSPFICLGGMGLPIFLDGSLGLAMQITGILAGIVAITMTIIFVTIDLLRMRKGRLSLN